jgi:large subunit ribosomal protein L7/L12
MSEKIINIIELLKNLTLIEIIDLIKNIEIIFNIKINDSTLLQNKIENNNIEEIKNVSAKEFTLILNSILPDKKITVLKLVRNLTGLGLKESKEIVDNLPHILKDKILKDEAEKIQKEFEEVGGTIILK